MFCVPLIDYFVSATCIKNHHKIFTIAGWIRHFVGQEYIKVKGWKRLFQIPASCIVPDWNKLYWTRSYANKSSKD